MKQIDKLIINSPYEEPKYYWHYDREHRSFEKCEGRRPAGYVVATPDKGLKNPTLDSNQTATERINSRTMGQISTFAF